MLRPRVKCLNHGNCPEVPSCTPDTIPNEKSRKNDPTTNKCCGQECSVLCNAPTLTYRPRIFCDPLGVMPSSYIWSEALRLNHHRRAIPLITTNSAPSVAPTSQSACAVDWSRLAVNEGSFAIISPAIQPNN